MNNKRILVILYKDPSTHFLYDNVYQQTHKRFKCMPFCSIHKLVLNLEKFFPGGKFAQFRGKFANVFALD